MRKLITLLFIFASLSLFGMRKKIPTTVHRDFTSPSKHFFSTGDSKFKLTVVKGVSFKKHNGNIFIQNIDKNIEEKTTLSKGDQILSINGKKFVTIRSLSRYIHSLPHNDEIVLQIVKNGYIHNIIHRTTKVY